MKLSSDKDTMAELKALILYILYKINKPITNDEFLKLVLTITDIKLFLLPTVFIRFDGCRIYIFQKNR